MCCNNVIIKELQNRSKYLFSLHIVFGSNVFGSSCSRKGNLDRVWILYVCTAYCTSYNSSVSLFGTHRYNYIILTSTLKNMLVAILSTTPLAIEGDSIAGSGYRG